MIADNIQLKVLAVNGHKVRLGITAPASIPVMRHELLMERQDAAGAGCRWTADAGVNGASSPEFPMCRQRNLP